MIQTSVSFILKGDRQALAAGNGARDRRDWTDAAAHYQRYLSTRPNHFAIWVQLGHALKEAGQPVEALVAYSRALALDQRDADLLINIGHLYKLMGHRNLAIEFYQSSYRQDFNFYAETELLEFGISPYDDGKNQTTKVRKLDAVLQRSRLARNAARLESLVRFRSKRILKIANESRDRADWSAAAEHYRSYLRLRPTRFPIWIQLGHALKEQGLYEDALNAYNTAYRSEMNNTDLLLSLGHLYKLMGRREIAISFYKRSAEIDGNLSATVEIEKIQKENSENLKMESIEIINTNNIHVTENIDTIEIHESHTPSAAEEIIYHSDTELQFVGSLDSVVGTTISGWIWDPRSPENAATLEIIINGNVAYSSVANIFRKDVKDYGHGSGVAGFYIKLPSAVVQRFASDGRVLVHVRLAGTHWELAGSPQFIDFSQQRIAGPPLRIERLSDWSLPAPPIRAIAFYLPQYHPFEENNKWWGAGFTEWTNVTRAQPLYNGHYQPQRPGELGFYDLRVSEIQERQAALARIFGLSGFCFYFYWFSGHILMERPITQFSENNNIDFPFCLCWANENWTRRWDGLESEILISQKYSAEDDLNFIDYISRYFSKKNYIKVDGKPLLMVYRIELLPDALATSLRWRDFCRISGIGEIYLVCTHSFSKIDPREFGFDAAVEFPPNGTSVIQVDREKLDCDPKFTGNIYDYEFSVENAKKYVTPEYPLIRSVFPSWDNTARRRTAATIFENSTPELYSYYLESVSRHVLNKETSSDKRMIFINAWNEWAEGARLEPDERSGYAYLEATRTALVRAGSNNKEVHLQRFGVASSRPRLAVVVHAFYLDVLEEFMPHFLLYKEGTEFYFTTPHHQLDEIQNILSNFPYPYKIFTVDNRGRDVAPFLQVLAELWARKFQYLLKLHTKKSTHRGDGDAWRNEIFSTIAEHKQVLRILAELDRKQDIGIVGPDNHILSMTSFWGSNAEHVMTLCRRLGVMPNVADAVFVAGTMFIARLEALEPLMALSITKDDFEPEAGQLDGTLAHAIERALSFSAMAVEMKVAGATIGSGGTDIISAGANDDYRFAKRST